jgi:hypothetical protein
MTANKFKSQAKTKKKKNVSVVDSGCLTRIRIFSIPDPGSRVKKIPDLG